MVSFLQNLSWDKVREMDREKTIVLVPFGATEQHGYHMPLGTDFFVADEIARVVGEKLKGKVSLLILPTMPFGHSPEHLEYDGTVSLKSETLLSLVKDITTSLAVQGFKKFVFLNAHGGNTDILKSYSYDLRYEHRAYMFVIDVWSLLTTVKDKPVDQKSRQDTDLHAGELETSMLLEINPELVEMEKAIDDIPKRFADQKYLRLVGPVFYGWSSLDVSESGISGEATKARKEIGEQLLEFLSGLAADAIKEIDDWEGAR